MTDEQRRLIKDKIKETLDTKVRFVEERLKRSQLRFQIIVLTVLLTGGAAGFFFLGKSHVDDKIDGKARDLGLHLTQEMEDFKVNNANATIEQVKRCRALRTQAELLACIDKALK